MRLDSSVQTNPSKADVPNSTPALNFVQKKKTSSFDLCPQAKVRESEEGISEHESFHVALLNMEKWLMVMRQKLESFRSPSGQWSVEGRRHEAEVCVGL